MRRTVVALVCALAVPASAQAPPAPPVFGEIEARVLSDGAVIEWTTDQDSDSEVDYGPTPEYGNSAYLNAPPATAHAVTLSGLAPDAIYHYRVKSRNAGGLLAVSGDRTFATPPAPPAPPPASTAPFSASGAPPMALIMTPPPGALASGVVTVSANATAGAGIASVQFLIDGRDLAPALTSPPFTFGWNTAGAGDGAHALAAVVRDSAGAAATSPIVLVTVDNTPPVIGDVSAAAVSADGAVVGWTTSEPADSQVEYGMTTEYGNESPQSGVRVLKRGVALSGLASEALYHYRVKSRDAAGQLAVSEDYLFATTEAPAGPQTDAASAGGPASAGDAAAKAPQRLLTPALADGINDRAEFGPEAREVTIVDIRGRSVFHRTANGSTISWNGRDDSGRLVPSGVYIAIVVTRSSKRVYQSFVVAK